MATLRIIGDVHGKIDDYIELALQSDRRGDYTLQVGDLSTSPTHYVKVELSLRPERHFVVQGNHDCYKRHLPHALGDFGVKEIPGWGSLFFVRGAFSIDKKWRIPGIEWFSTEELGYADLNEMLNLYRKVKPDFVVTHDCPRLIVNQFSNDYMLRQCGFDPKTFTTKTSEALSLCFQSHEPKNWYFGHYHKKWTADVGGCRFRCLDELEYVDVPAIKE